MTFLMAKKKDLALFRETRYVHFGGDNCLRDAMIYIYKYTKPFRRVLLTRLDPQRRRTKPLELPENEDTSDSEDIDEL